MTSHEPNDPSPPEDKSRLESETTPSLKRATLQGVRWTSLARIVVEASALGSSIILARLLPPSAFGAAAVALTVAALAVIIGPPGVTAHVVQRRTISEDGLRSAWFLSIALGIGLTIATFAFGFLAAGSIFGSEVADLITLVSPAWLFAAFGAVPYALLLRGLRFKRIAAIDSCTALSGTLVALVGAVAGAGSAALILGALTTFVVSSTCSMLSAGVLAPRPTRNGLAEGRGSVAVVSLSSLVYSVYRNVDYTILAWKLTPEDVGLYYRAYQLGVDYQGKISQILVRVSFPIFSKATDAEELGQLRSRIVGVHAAALIPILAAFAALAPDLIPWFYGEAWEPSVVPAQILSIAGMAAVVGTGTGPLMIAAGKSATLLRWSIAELIVYATLITMTAPHGLLAVCISVSIFAVASTAFQQLVILRPILKLTVRDIGRDVSPGVVVGTFVFLSIEATLFALSEVDVVFVRLAVGTLVGFATAVAVLRLLYKPVWGDLTSVVSRKRNS